MLRNNPGGISYMWTEATGDLPGVKILAELWRGTVD
jgi:hypothetical protein